jgi:hypothetical protein
MSVLLFLTLLVFAACNVDDSNNSEEEILPTIKQAELTDREEMIISSITSFREIAFFEVLNIDEFSRVNIYIDKMTTQGLEKYTSSSSMLNKEKKSFYINVSFGDLGEDNHTNWIVSVMDESGYSKSNMKVENPYRDSSLTSKATDKELVDDQKNVFLTLTSTYGNELLSSSVDYISSIDELSVNQDEIMYIFSIELIR